MENIKTITSAKISYPTEDVIFDILADSINKTFEVRVDEISDENYRIIPGTIKPKYPLWDLYLNNIDESIRQQYNCNTCRKFIDTYGGLVGISRDNKVVSLLWDEDTVPDMFKKSVKAMRESCEQGRILLNWFYCESFWHDIAVNDIIGKKRPKGAKNEYNHFYIDKYNANKLSRIHINTFTNSVSALIKLELIKQEDADAFASFLKCNDLSGIEDYQWAASLKDLVEEFRSKKANVPLLAIKYSQMNNWRWAGFNSSIMREILDGILEGNSFDTLKSRYLYLRDPIRFMRPVNDASDQLIKEANKLFAENGITIDSLKRRPARVDELTYLWKEEEKAPIEVHGEPKDAGVFDSLLEDNKNKKYSPKFITKEKMSLNKFITKVLPYCESISLKCDGNLMQLLCYYGVWFNTATVQDSAPILRWDRLDKRQPVSQYQIQTRVTPQLYVPNCMALDYIDIYGVCYDVHYWTSDVDPETISSTGLNFIFKKDGKVIEQVANSLSLFPEIVDSKFHSIRRVIEQFSNTNPLDPIEPNNAIPAVGFRYIHGMDYKFTIRAKTKINGYMDILITLYETE